MQSLYEKYFPVLTNAIAAMGHPLEVSRLGRANAHFASYRMLLDITGDMLQDIDSRLDQTASTDDPFTVKEGIYIVRQDHIVLSGHKMAKGEVFEVEPVDKENISHEHTAIIKHRDFRFDINRKILQTLLREGAIEVFIKKLPVEKKVCRIINARFSWILSVDDQEISFQSMENADYFERHYAGLGYEVIREKRDDIY